MTTMIQLKQVLRNKRFVLFTILIPLAWYLFIYNVQKDVVPNILLGIAVFIGIIGNSLATFSKRISSNIGFYSFESSFSRYGLKNFLLDQTLVQVFLNALIFAVVLIFAVLYAHFPLHGSLVIQFLLLSVMGIYFSIIGFVLGVRVDAKILDTVGFPIIVLAAMTIMPFASFGADDPGDRFRDRLFRKRYPLLCRDVRLGSPTAILPDPQEEGRHKPVKTSIAFHGFCSALQAPQ